VLSLLSYCPYHYFAGLEKAPIPFYQRFILKLGGAVGTVTLSKITFSSVIGRTNAIK